VDAFQGGGLKSGSSSRRLNLNEIRRLQNGSANVVKTLNTKGRIKQKKTRNLRVVQFIFLFYFYGYCTALNPRLFGSSTRLFDPGLKYQACPNAAMQFKSLKVR